MHKKPSMTTHHNLKDWRTLELVKAGLGMLDRLALLLHNPEWAHELGAAVRHEVEASWMRYSLYHPLPQFLPKTTNVARAHG